MTNVTLWSWSGPSPKFRTSFPYHLPNFFLLLCYTLDQCSLHILAVPAPYGLVHLSFLHLSLLLLVLLPLLLPLPLSHLRLLCPHIFALFQSQSHLVEFPLQAACRSWAMKPTRASLFRSFLLYVFTLTESKMFVASASEVGANILARERKELEKQWKNEGNQPEGCFIQEHPCAISFFGSTRYYTIFWILIRLSHDITRYFPFGKICA